MRHHHYRPRTDRNAYLHAGGYSRLCQGHIPQGSERGYPGRNHTRKHIPPLSQARAGYSEGCRRPAQVHIVGQADTYGQRRIPGILALPYPETDSGRLHFLFPYRRVTAQVHP